MLRFVVESREDRDSDSGFVYYIVDTGKYSGRYDRNDTLGVPFAKKFATEIDAQKALIDFLDKKANSVRIQKIQAETWLKQLTYR